jgi:hypothetical protein
MPRLRLTRVRIDGGPVTPATNAEVDAAERELGVAMPTGYREYVTTFGGGALDMLVRVLPPKSILEQLEEHRSRYAAYWFWAPSDLGFDEDAAMTSIPIADTLEGDAVALWPADPSRLIVLPRHEERLIVRPADLLEVVEWICAGGLGHEPSPERVFTPWDRREAEPTPRETVRIDLDPPPDLHRPPRDLLLAYFAELEAVESWAAAQDGIQADPFAETGTAESDEMIARTNELIARSDRVHARYGTPGFRTAMGGGSVTVTHGRRQAHDPNGIRLLDETPLGATRVGIQAVHGLPYGEVNDYVFERTGEDWRIASMRLVDVIPPGGGGLAKRIRGLFSRE